MPRPHSLLTRFPPACPSRPMRLKLETLGATSTCPITRGSVASCHVGRRHPHFPQRVAAPDPRYLKRWDRTNLDVVVRERFVVRGRPSQGQYLSLPFALHHIKHLARVSESFPHAVPASSGKDSGRFLVQRGISADRRSHGVVCVVRACLSDLFRRLMAADVLGTLSLSHTRPAQRWDGIFWGVY